MKKETRTVKATIFVPWDRDGAANRDVIAIFHREEGNVELDPLSARSLRRVSTFPRKCEKGTREKLNSPRGAHGGVRLGGREKKREEIGTDKRLGRDRA